MEKSNTIVDIKAENNLKKIQPLKDIPVYDTPWIEEEQRFGKNQIIGYRQPNIEEIVGKINEIIDYINAN